MSEWVDCRGTFWRCPDHPETQVWNGCLTVCRFKGTPPWRCWCGSELEQYDQIDCPNTVPSFALSKGGPL